MVEQTSIQDLMKRYDITATDVAPYKAELEERIRLYELQETRKAQDLTQVELAKRMGVSQKRVSELENGDIDHTQIATLKRYVEALGGVLHVTASLPGKIEPLVIA